MKTMKLGKRGFGRYAHRQLMPTANLLCVLLVAHGVGSTVRAAPPTPQVGNWKWLVSVETRATSFDSAQSRGSDHEKEVAKLKDKFENKLRNELSKRCTFTTYDNIASAGTIEIALTITRDASVKGNTTAVYHQGPTANVDGVGPDRLPVKPGATEVVSGTVDQFKDVRLKVKPKKLHVVQVRLRILDSGGKLRDSIDVEPRGSIDAGMLADNLVSAMALVRGKSE